MLSLQKTSIEVRYIFVPNLITYTDDLSITRREQFTGFANPDLGQEVVEGVTSRFLEKA